MQAVGSKNNRVSRLTYSNAIVGLGRDPGKPVNVSTGFRGWFEPDDDTETQTIREAVEAAVGQLDAEEREFVRCFYFMGWTTGEIAEATGREEYRVVAMHDRVVRRLRACLGPFVRERYGIGGRRGKLCPICAAGRRDKAEQVIARKRPEETWGPVMRELRERFGIAVGSPQTLISHWRYHMPPGKLSGEGQREEADGLADESGSVRGE